MGVAKLILRVLKIIVFLYGVWTAIKKSRWLAIGLAILEILRRKPDRDVDRAATFTFVNALEPAIYRRQGWRRLVPRKIARH